MRPFFYFVILCCTVLTACGQQLKTIASLPSVLGENSGLLYAAPNSIWTHNDGGNANAIYELDSLGNIRRTLGISNAQNIDWEDITKDDKGYTYVGDFGNNNNRRQDLVIYKVSNPWLNQDTTIQAEKIRFYYPEQVAYPPLNAQKDYDMEAMIYWEDSLYLFTKNRTSPYDSYTKLYRLPTDTGYHAAELIDSFDTKESSNFFSITAGALSSDGRYLALLNSNKVFLFGPIQQNRFFDAPLQKINLGNIKQREAIDFIDNQHLYISHESSLLGSAALQLLDITMLTGLTNKSIASKELQIYPNPAVHQLTIKTVLQRAGNISIRLYSGDGKRIKKLYSAAHPMGKFEEVVALPTVASGSYLIQIKYNKHRIFKRILIQQP